MRVLGIDLGIKRTGLALSDETGTAIRLLPNLIAHSRLKVIEKIIHLVKDFSVQVVVIGCPMPKTVGSKAIYVRAHGLCESLTEALRINGLDTKTYVWDESMTSKQASCKLIEAGIPKKKRSLMLDAASAAIMVEDFLRGSQKNANF
jgi:putative Holliday junction resolvase